MNEKIAEQIVAFLKTFQKTLESGRDSHSSPISQTTRSDYDADRGFNGGDGVCCVLFFGIAFSISFYHFFNYMIGYLVPIMHFIGTKL